MVCYFGIPSSFSPQSLETQSHFYQMVPVVVCASFVTWLFGSYHDCWESFLQTTHYSELATSARVRMSPID